MGSEAGHCSPRVSRGRVWANPRWAVPPRCQALGRRELAPVCRLRGGGTSRQGVLWRSSFLFSEPPVHSSS